MYEEGMLVDCTVELGNFSHDTELFKPCIVNVVALLLSFFLNTVLWFVVACLSWYCGFHNRPMSFSHVWRYDTIRLSTSVIEVC